MTVWITYDEAARLAGCNRATITNAVRRGDLVSRGLKAKPSIDRNSVYAWIIRRSQERQAAHAREQRRLDNTQPPDQLHHWLTLDQAGALLGVTGHRVAQLAREGRIPHWRRGRRVWVRRDHAEQAAVARGVWSSPNSI